MATHSRQLNDGWNAEPNAPDPRISVEGSALVLSVLANPFRFPRFAEGQRIRLRFAHARRFRFGSTNEEGWYRGQCRFSGDAPEWGEFYEVSGDLKLDQCPDDWQALDASIWRGRHFLFYLRDGTFECEADDWTLFE